MISKNFTLEDYGNLIREEGKVEGFFEGIAKVVQNMFVKTSDIDEIVEMTGLDKAEIEKIHRKWKETQS